MTDYSPRLKVQYKDKITNALMEEFSYKNRMQLPKLDKIVLNVEKPFVIQRKLNKRKQI